MGILPTFFSDLLGQVASASNNLKPCAKGEITYECGASVKYEILWGKPTIIEIAAPNGEIMDALNESELVQNLKKGIPPNG